VAKQFLTLMVVLAALSAVSCNEGATSITLVNNASDPFHPNGGSKLEPGSSQFVRSLKHGSVMTITIEREGSTWATLTVTSNYSPKDEEPTKATLTVTEEPYGTFHASSDNSAIDVSVQN
jgi:hypothetical protein